jgi:opacity protein-like surface antigen
MNRMLILCFLALGLTVSACASDVVDPVPVPPAAEEQRLPPEQPLSTELRDPAALLLGGIEIDHRLDHVPQVDPNPDPGPWPEAR